MSRALQLVRSDRARPFVVAAVGALIAAAGALPLWVARLAAPQYPQGLWLVAYGGRLEGDVNEVNNLNHYIGMRTIDPAAIPEMQLWPLALAAAAAFALIALFTSGWPSRLARIGLFLIPLAVLADIQRWLYVFGHDLDPTAALRPKPFTPLVVGPTKVWNFEILALPGLALVAVLLAAVIVALAARPAAPRTRRRLAPASARVGLVLTLVVALALALMARPALGTAPFDLPAAILRAEAGAEIHVPAGVYVGPIVVDRPVKLIAQGDAILDGRGAGTVVVVAAPDVTVTGFVVRGSGGQMQDAAGIAVRGDAATIARNHFHDVYVGVLARGVERLRIVGNGFHGPSAGAGAASLDEAHGTDHGGAAVADAISLWDVRDALVRDNLVEGFRDGLYLQYSDDVLVDGNRFTGGRYAVHAMFGSTLVVFGNRIARNASGLVLMYTSEVDASRNEIVSNRGGGTGYGIAIKDVRGVRALENVVVRNVVGIRAEGVDHAAAPAEILRNRVALNDVGLQILPSASLVFSRNAFSDNLVQVEQPGATGAGRSEWTKSGLGNEWSGYPGGDMDGDGIGDLSHREGGAAARLFAAAPELGILRHTLAAALVARAERWWSLGRGDAITDPMPMLAAPAPLLAGRAMGPLDGIVWTGASALLAAIVGGAVALGRSRA